MDRAATGSTVCRQSPCGLLLARKGLSNGSKISTEQPDVDHLDGTTRTGFASLGKQLQTDRQIKTPGSPKRNCIRCSMKPPSECSGDAACRSFWGCSVGATVAADNHDVSGSALLHTFVYQSSIV